MTDAMHRIARTRLTCVNADPAESPTLTSPLPLRAETIEFAISGRSVPIATTVTPTRPAETPAASEALTAWITARRLAAAATTSPTASATTQTTIIAGTATSVPMMTRRPVCPKGPKYLIGRNGPWWVGARGSGPDLARRHG